MKKHSPELWTFELDEYYSSEPTQPVTILDAKGVEVFDADGRVDGAWAKPVDIRRIVACVNACAGIPTEKLETNYIAIIEVFKTLKTRK